MTAATAAGPKIASLFTGTGQLDRAVQDVFGGDVAWHCQFDPTDKHQFAARILAHHYPQIPNLGDITAADWQQVLALYGTVHILTGGFPCTDLSAAGLRAGLAEGTRSGLWIHMARAVGVLRPQLVVIENVEGILSARADRGMGPSDEDVEAAGPDALRALGCVLGDLADLGYDAEWLRVAASDVGAPHRRYRIVVLAWPATADADGFVSGNDGELSTGWDALQQRLRDDAPRCGAATADPADLGHEWPGAARQWGHGLADGDLVAADTEGFGRGEGRPEPAGQLWGSDDAQCGGPAGGYQPCCALHGVDWLDWGPAVHRWSALFRPVPWPTDVRGRLNPEFSEWAMGWPAGLVTSVPAAPGMTEPALRNARLKAIGNGVVPQQIAYGIRIILDRLAATGIPMPAALETAA